MLQDESKRTVEGAGASAPAGAAIECAMDCNCALDVVLCHGSQLCECCAPTPPPQLLMQHHSLSSQSAMPEYMALTTRTSSSVRKAVAVDAAHGGGRCSAEWSLSRPTRRMSAFIAPAPSGTVFLRPARPRRTYSGCGRDMMGARGGRRCWWCKGRQRQRAAAALGERPGLGGGAGQVRRGEVLSKKQGAQDRERQDARARQRAQAYKTSAEIVSGAYQLAGNSIFVPHGPACADSPRAAGPF